MNNVNEQEEEFLSIPPTTVIDAEGMRKIAEVEANDEAHRAAKFQEIRYENGDTKIVRIVKLSARDKIDLFKNDDGSHFYEPYDQSISNVDEYYDIIQHLEHCQKILQDIQRNADEYLYWTGLKYEYVEKENRGNYNE